MVNLYSKSLFVLILAVGLFGCLGEGELESLNLTASSIVDLKDTAGNVPAQVRFEGSPSSIQGADEKKTLNVPFMVGVDLRASQQAFQAIIPGGEAEIILEIIFYDIDKNAYPFKMGSLFESSELARTTGKRFALPLAIEDLARIDFRVDGQLVATHPPTKDLQ